MPARSHLWTRSSAIAKRPAPRSVLIKMLFYRCTNNANTSPVNPSSTFSNCHVLFRYLHSFVHISLSYRTSSMGYLGCHHQTSVPVYNQPCWCQLDRNCDRQISTSIRLKCWWHRVFFRKRTVMDADHCGGWTQIFGGRASELRLLDQL